MEVQLHKQFVKQFKKLPVKVQDKFYQRLSLYLEDASSPILNTHKLRGDGEPLISINVTGDYRALFTLEGTLIVFHRIGTHSKLY